MKQVLDIRRVKGEGWPCTLITQVMNDGKIIYKLKTAKYSDVRYVVCNCVDIKRNVASDCLDRLITDQPTMSSQI